jgi:hexokinase
MPPLHALNNHNSQRVFDDINSQFQLSPEVLTQLTVAFVDEIGLGLASYNHAMAMVYVLFFTHMPILIACDQSYICHR